MSRIRYFVSPSTLYHIYRSLIQSYLLYSIVAWDNAAKIHRTKILTLQKRALHLLYFGYYLQYLSLFLLIFFL